MKNLPQKIYLNIDLAGDTCEDFNELSGVSWSASRIYEDDIEYVLRIDKPTQIIVSFIKKEISKRRKEIRVINEYLQSVPEKSIGGKSAIEERKTHIKFIKQGICAIKKLTS